VLLNEMTAEMRDQFAAFRTLRKAAEIGASGSGDDAAAKLARADLKAATDAMSLIVRTLEKIDQLQRQFARDREQAAEDNEAAMGLDDAKAIFLDLIEQRRRSAPGSYWPTGNATAAGTTLPSRPQRKPNRAEIRAAASATIKTANVNVAHKLYAGCNDRSLCLERR
jgi:hypothetical protein